MGGTLLAAGDVIDAHSQGISFPFRPAVGEAFEQDTGAFSFAFPFFAFVFFFCIVPII